MKTAIYIDGFNLYYGIKKTTYKWLNIKKLAQNLLPTANIELIKYFTAIVKARPDDLQQQNRQLIYLRALKTIPNLKIIRGHFLENERWLPKAKCYAYHVDKTKVIRTEEKGSDVNLASHLIVDAYKDLYDEAWVMTNDSDLCEPIKLVRKELGLFVGVINPHHFLKNSRSLANASSDFIQINLGDLQNAQFPDTFKDTKGTITKPTTW